jgi:predicted metal-dependent peptidase
MSTLPALHSRSAVLDPTAAAFERIARAKAGLLIRDPFFGFLLSRLDVVETRDPAIDTMATDGARLFVNVAFVLSLSERELEAVLVHEVLHCAYRHFSRRGSRPLPEFNVAADYAINGDVVAAGYTLPRGFLYDARFNGRETEWIYDSLFGSKPDPADQDQDQDQDQEGDQDQDGAGDGSDGDQDGADQDQDADGSDGADQDGDGADADQGDADGSDGEAGDGSDADGDGDQDGAGESGADQDGGDQDGEGDAAGDGADGSPGRSGGRGKPGRGKGDQDQDADQDGADGAGDADGEPDTGDGRPIDPGRSGGILDAPPVDADQDGDQDPEQLSRDWSIWTRQAVAAATRANAGTVPGHLQRLVADLNRPRVDWRDVLRRFVSESMVRDYSWSRPNRRFLGSPFVLPGLRSDSLNRIVLILDTSGSVFSVLDLLRQILAEATALIEDGAADRLTVLHVDTAVRRVDEFERGDVFTSTDPVGGGGTDFAPAFAWIDEHAADAAAVIYFTDLECWSYGREPAAPVLWAAYGRPEAVEYHGARVPFGEIVRVS